MNITEYAALVKKTIDKQAEFFAVAKKQKQENFNMALLTHKERLLAESKALEKQLKQATNEILSNTNQTSLF